MIAIRRARTADAPGIGAVHVASWRSAYAGVLPEPVLTGLSAPDQAGYYDRVIRSGAVVHVAVASGTDLSSAVGRGEVVGFVTGRRRRRALADAEIETLYVLDDYRERGLGRELLSAAMAHLAGRGCASAVLWVLADNPARWFYERMGGRRVAEGSVEVGGVDVPQIAYRWDGIERFI
ncbi:MULTISPECIES: GNAT family N-acetyltransferase [Acidiphilium]|jgi:ribosomal protein S18 acetylase RimI-like enzyme|uniref:GCN5-related N-acetyltransferase n=2 Tax=Acidiphilium TaxID=522 RepID=A5FXS2_ACICJ|nr:MULTISPECIES: GNAT family N-acetyltransferase [Acidiphilium]ABQ30404.1 GCN5-related N-acetyltransferase [Acidiphilium cryptum JF-5]EGO93539.1 GCN5-related N-acetyltransferase [Acidiphilium sp. PM]KDM66788.1 GCN5-like N-acetyltransferase [Acidiphilium sp. JA12-A1]MBS3025144.1 GNAT family N-acetyltransferase [Acidiphilium multivorum]UNC12905.1 GNAT family N-acetyltransferase [Acidiphilium multivorum]